MKLIPLTQGQFAIVDECDYEYLMQWKWRAGNSGKINIKYYALRTDRTSEKKIDVFMHKEILKRINPDMKNTLLSDHKNRNTLDNRRCNLRYATVQQNACNRTAWGCSKFLGVHKQKRYSYIYWVSRINVGNRRISLGYFKNEEDAARAYDKAAKIYHGEFANLNFPDE
jgi:hypothetical protein